MQIWSAEIKELESLYTLIKGRFPELEKDLEHLIKTDDENVALLYSRRCLEIIVTDLCINELKRPRQTEPLKGIIDKLNREEKCPSHIIASMQSLNSLSSFGTHPKEYDPRQVRPVLISLTTVIEWYLKYKYKKNEVIDGKIKRKYEREGLDLKEKTVWNTKSNRKLLMIVLGLFLTAIVFILIYFQPDFFRKDKFETVRDSDGRISIAVMPFNNLTGDSIMNFWQSGISEFLINALGTSNDLSVMTSQVMTEVFESIEQIQTASVLPSLAKEAANKVKAGMYITGNLLGSEGDNNIMVNLINTKTGEVIWSSKVQGNLETSYRNLLDSLSNLVKNYLEIRVLEQKTGHDFQNAFPKSALAYRFYIEGMNSILRRDYDLAIQSLKKALDIDSTFTFAYFYLAWAYNYSYQDDLAKIWTKKAYSVKDKLPVQYQLWLELWKISFFDKDLMQIIQCCESLERANIKSRFLWFDLGVTYALLPLELKKTEKAIKAFKNAMEISLDWGGYWKYLDFYTYFGRAYHDIGKHKEEKEIYKIGLSIYPDNQFIIFRQAICALSQGNTTEASQLITKYKTCIKESGDSESVLEFYLGRIYQEAHLVDQSIEHFQNAHNLDPQNLNYIRYLAWLLIDNDINISKGMELVDNALKYKPDNNQLYAHLLHAQGWGYYKQGRYQEALRTLEIANEKFVFYDYETSQNILTVKQAIENQNK